MDFVSHFVEVSRHAIGKVELQDKHAFFDIDQKLARAVVKRFDNAKWNERALRMNFDDGPKREKPEFRKGIANKKKAAPLPRRKKR
ncbi:MAG: DbpA RNA binding domain-containing protein [Saprospiraceae bacterium]